MKEKGERNERENERNERENERKEKEMKEKVINLTPHDVVVVSGNTPENLVIPASGMIARCQSTRSRVGLINNRIPVNKTKFGQVEGLPKPSKDTIYIVSRIVAEAVKAERSDCYIVDDTVRDDASGQIIGCKALAQL